MLAAVQATFTTSYLHTILIFVVGTLLLDAWIDSNSLTSEGLLCPCTCI